MKLKKLGLSIIATCMFAISALGQVPDTVNIGTGPNSGNGDPLRTGIDKLNTNDQWLGQQNALVWDSITAHNLRLLD